MDSQLWHIPGSNRGYKIMNRPYLAALPIPVPPPWFTPPQEPPKDTEPELPIKVPVSGGYVDIPLGRFLLGLGAVSVPVIYMQYSGREDWAGKYILLIVLGFLVVNYRGLETFVNYVGGK
jgi:hypothetical protein